MKMPVLQVVHLLFSFLYPAQSNSEADCKLWKDLDSTVVYKEGHVVLAGMFPIHSKGVNQELNFRSQPDQRKCTGFNMRVFRWSQSMIFFIEEINRNPTLLPNITLGYRLYDTCGLTALSLRTALSVVSQPMKRSSLGECSSPRISIIIGDSGSTLSMAISRILNLFRISLVSYFASCSCLSDKHQFPYFFRTIPSDVYQASALARLVKHFGWTWVGTIGADDAYGRTGIDLFTTAVAQLGVCVAYRVIIPKLPTQQQLQDIVKTIRDSTALVLVVFAIEEDIKPVVDEIVRQNVTGKQWVASEAWVTSTLISTKKNYPSLSGTIGFAIRRAEIPGLKQFLESIQPQAEPYNAFAKEYWETQFQCLLNTSLPAPSTTEQVHYTHSCTGMERVQDIHSIYNDVSELRVTYNMHKAVYTVAHALHNLLICQKEIGSALTQQCPDIDNLQPWQVVEVLRKVNYTNMFGDLIHFDKNGDPVGSYHIVNWQRGLDEGTVQYVTVGRFDSSLSTAQQLLLNQDKIIWHGGTKEIPVSVCSASCPQGYRKVTREGQPVCCYDCVLCAEGSISNITDQPECMLCPEDFWSNQRRNLCVPKQIEFLSYSEAFGMALAAVAILGVVAAMTAAAIFFRHRDTPLVRANNSELSFLLLISLTLCFICALTFLGQPSRWACPLRRTAFGLSFALCLSCLLSKTLVVLMAFKATLPGNNNVRWFRPPQQRLGVFLCSVLQGGVCVVWLITAPPYPVRNTWLYRDRIILECHLGSVALFCCVLGYIGCLAAFCFILAFLARKLPDNFNEAKFITFSMLIFCAVWITFIPAYVSSPGKFTVAVEIFAILASSYGVLLCIFAPKCYIIIFMPERNSKKFLMAQK
ncbi:olfactory receptor CW1 [Siphateles boraxobius]|uniref:olfactory receptor CW1 n=1 Tax=Siphateles boraxobius TaxID=180520 RepID=UPI0040636580